MNALVSNHSKNEAHFSQMGAVFQAMQALFPHTAVFWFFGISGGLKELQRISPSGA
jgi:hypothetical protein